MALESIDPREARAGLRALKMVALASNGLHDAERRLLRAAGTALGIDDEPEALQPIDPAEVAETLAGAKPRQWLIEAMLLMAMMDQEVDRDEIAVIDRFARALSVDEPALKNVRQFVEGHHLRLKADVMRRSYFAKKVAPAAWKEGGVAGLWRAFGPRMGLATDPELAWKYKQLGLLPAGTLGRAYWVHCTERKFTLPGEPYGFPWQVVHDMGHVLGNHDTDPHGEVEQAAFEAGYMKRDPFFLIFAITMIFHVGYPILGDTYIGVAKGQFDPEAAVDAFARGAAVRVDLTEWDYWPHIARPIDEVRDELGITPRKPRLDLPRGTPL